MRSELSSKTIDDLATIPLAVAVAYVLFAPIIRNLFESHTALINVVFEEFRSRMEIRTAYLALRKENSIEIANRSSQIQSQERRIEQLGKELAERNSELEDLKKQAENVANEIGYLRSQQESPRPNSEAAEANPALSKIADLLSAYLEAHTEVPQELSLQIPDESGLVEYQQRMFPNTPIDKDLTAKVANDLKGTQLRTIPDLHRALLEAKSFNLKYAMAAPQMYKTITDFVSKAAGLASESFREHHGFSQGTIEAYSSLSDDKLH